MCSGWCTVNLDTLRLWLQLLTLNRATPGRRSSDRGDCSDHLCLHPSRCHDGKCGCMTQIPLLLHRHPDLFFFNPCLFRSVDYQIVSLPLTCRTYKVLIPLGCMCSCLCCRVDESSCQSFSTVGLVNENPDWNQNNDGINQKKKVITIKSVRSRWWCGKLNTRSLATSGFFFQPVWWCESADTNCSQALGDIYLAILTKFWY